MVPARPTGRLRRAAYPPSNRAPARCPVRVVFGSLGPGGCFTGEEGADVVALSATALIATAPEWPAAATVSV